MKRFIVASIISGFLFISSVPPAHAIVSEGIGAVVVVGLLILKPFKKSDKKFND